MRVLRGINLVSCDAKGSDPYVVLSLDGQVGRLQTFIRIRPAGTAIAASCSSDSCLSLSSSSSLHLSSLFIRN